MCNVKIDNINAEKLRLSEKQKFVHKIMPKDMRKMLFLNV